MNKKIFRRRQMILRRNFYISIAINMLIVLTLMIVSLSMAISSYELPAYDESTSDYHLTAGVETVLYESTDDAVETEQSIYPMFEYSKDWDANDSYLLAKIAMCEAGNQSTETKALVILTVPNRVWDDYFPDTIEEVIFQKAYGVYQFSPIGDGSWERNEPNEDCWKAVQMVMESLYDYSSGALYFESCVNEDNWHSRNLEFLYQSQDMRFYK